MELGSDSRCCKSRIIEQKKSNDAFARASARVLSSQNKHASNTYVNCISFFIITVHSTVHYTITFLYKCQTTQCRATSTYKQ